MAVSFIGGGTRVPGENHRPVDAKKVQIYSKSEKLTKENRTHST
jgi:hypothetical protein